MNKQQASVSRIAACHLRAFVRGLAIVLVLGFAAGGGPATAQDAPPLPPLFSYQLSVTRPGAGTVLELRGAPADPNDVDAPFISRATVRVSPLLCQGSYRLAFALTTLKGRIAQVTYTARMHSGRHDGVAKRCPFAGLPARGLKSMQVRVTLDDEVLMRFSAMSSAHRGSPFAWLQVPSMSFYRTTAPGGLVRVRVRALARYRSGETRLLRFRADARYVGFTN